MRHVSQGLMALATIWALGCPPQGGKLKTDLSSLEQGTVVLETSGRVVRVDVELALTPAQRSHGLKLRKRLGPYQGMLFVFDRDEVQSFWMQDTYIPLDMIFISADGVVVGFVENTTPMTTTSRRVGKPSRHVLEVNAGFCRNNGIQPGSRVSFQGIDELRR